MPEQFLVDGAALRAVLEYLGKRPFAEVRLLVEALEQSRAATVAEEQNNG